MARREFSKDVKRQAHARAGGFCEGIKADGVRCSGALLDGRFHYDHNIPDALGGEPELCNCVVLCIPCHAEKTAKRDVPMIAKAKRVADRQIGIRNKSTFPKREPQRSASRPITKKNAYLAALATAEPTGVGGASSALSSGSEKESDHG